MFEHLGQIQPQEDGDGLFPQGLYANARGLAFNQYGQGPFCRFAIARGRNEAGLYILTRDDQPVYVGECVNVGRRWGPSGYGGISPRNCFSGGQPTNCRINAGVRVQSRMGAKLDLWFKPLDGDKAARLAAERNLITALSPPWNRR